MALSIQIIDMIRKRQELGLPEEIRQKVKLHIADTIGIALAAHKGAPIALKALAGISSGSEGGCGRVIGSAKRMPPAYAAFSNTALAHALDYDDIHDLARVHPTPVTLAAALAAGDMAKNKDTDLVTAVALGNELICRLGYALEPKGNGPDAKWFLSQLFGYLGAAVTTGLVLGLTDSQMVHALGLAYMQAAGGKEPGVGVGSQARSIYPAFASMGGVQAALLAKEGMTAPASSLDGKTGFFRIYLEKNLDDRQQKQLLDTEHWAFADTSIKLFPSCRYSHPYIKSALVLRHRLESDTVEKIVIGVNDTANMLCSPLNDRCQPKTLQDAKFSIPFMVAFSLVHGSVNLNNLTDEELVDDRVLELASLIDIERTQPNAMGLPQGDIKIITNSGVYTHVECLSSNAAEEEIRQKFIECCQFANIIEAEGLWREINHNPNYEVVGKLPQRVG